MLSILFVDDEPRILEGIQRMLRPMRGEWSMRFVASGPAALEELARAPAEVVVSDMRMPGMSGADVLEQVRQRWPDAVRIVLSGQADEGLVARVVHCAHQFLGKPCEPEALKATIRRACALRAMVADPALRRLAGGIDALPSVPALYHELMAIMADPAAAIADAAAVVGRDPAMSAKLIQVVNSGFFGLRRKVTLTVDAATLLGMDALRALVLGEHAFKSMTGESTLADELWRHSSAVAGACRAIARAESASKSIADQAFMAGMLHDVGQTLLETRVGTTYAALVHQTRAHDIRLDTAEQALLKASHGPLGGYLLGLWGLADDIVEAVAHHHEPSRAGSAVFGPLAIVHVADALLDAGAGGRLDGAYLASIGVAARVPDWTSLVETGRAGSP
ncbi:MAG TPA: HDOD domain-containing protein [Planctomycetota bacterium]|nr:HDOD domain-containing protein [Planctomycetota bacterium]